MKMRSIGIAIVLIVLIVGGVLIYKRDAARSLGDTLRSVKDTSQDAATTSKVKTALLLSKHVSAFDIKATTSRGEVTLTGSVPSRAEKLLAEKVAQSVEGVKKVVNNLSAPDQAAG